jgi:hypothetical protein
MYKLGDNMPYVAAILSYNLFDGNDTIFRLFYMIILRSHCVKTILNDECTKFV